MDLSSSKCCVDLHLHLDGAARPATLFEIAKKRQLAPHIKSVDEMANNLLLKDPATLEIFLKPFPLINDCMRGDKESLARVVKDFAEDCHNKSNLCYFEARLCPIFCANEQVDADAVLKLVLETLDSCCKKYEMSYTMTLAILRTDPKMTSEIIDLAKKYQSHGVTGLDIAGDDAVISHNLHDDIHGAYKEAKRIGLFRTAHAGENGTAMAIKQAIDEFDVHRIGHGYKVFTDPELYKIAIDRKIHFEACPKSSVLTGSAPTDLKEHPILKFQRDGANYSINTDDPTITGNWLQEEFAFCQKVGLTKAQIEAANIRAAQAAFLPEDKKDQLVSHVMKYSSKTVTRFFDNEAQ